MSVVPASPSGFASPPAGCTTSENAGVKGVIGECSIEGVLLSEKLNVIAVADEATVLLTVMGTEVSVVAVFMPPIPIRVLLELSAKIASYLCKEGRAGI